MGIMLEKPTPINSSHVLELFDSGNEELNIWLRLRAIKNEQNRASRTFVVHQQNLIKGYYSLAAGAVSHLEATRNLRQNMPNPIPVMILGRLAVDLSCQGKGLGTALVKDAVLRTMNAADIAGIKAIAVQAIDQKAVDFYKKFGFKESIKNNRMLLFSLEKISENIK